MRAEVDPGVVTDRELRRRIAATGLAWWVRDRRTGIDMLLVPPGTFAMGCSVPVVGGQCDAFELPVHSVELTAPLYVGRDEVTQAQWKAQMAGGNPSTFQSGADADMRPVETVPLLGTGSIDEFLLATGMRLPTEAEWEYSCRAGTSTPWYDGSTNPGSLGALAWFNGNSGGTTHPVGQRVANGFGLRDMLGNVAEWVVDQSQAYDAQLQINPTGPQSDGPSSRSVLRGGAWDATDAPDTRATASARGSSLSVHTEDATVGFRVVRAP